MFLFVPPSQVWASRQRGWIFKVECYLLRLWRARTGEATLSEIRGESIEL